VYFPELLAPLLRTLLHLTSPPFISPPKSSPPPSPCLPTTNPPKIVISYKIRSLLKETPFWSAFGLWFSFVPVLRRRKRIRTISNHRSEGSHPQIQDNATLESSIENVANFNESETEEREREWERFGSSDQDESIFIFVGYRRPESLVWNIPRSNEDLLGGVIGDPEENGIYKRKMDETFESLLLMEMASA